MYPELLKEWDYTKNPFSPELPVPGSTVVVHWVCSEGHSYEKPINKRVSSYGCPYCSTHSKLLTGFNDLATKFPNLLQEWDYAKNDLDPSQVKSTETRAKRFWICADKHQWAATVQNRAARGSGCPECSKKTAKGEIELLEFIRSLGYTAIYTDRTIIAPYEVDVWIPELNLAFEFNGVYWHSEEMIQSRYSMSALDYHNMKYELARKSKVRLAFVWQDDWVLNPEETKRAIESTLKSGIAPLLSNFEKPYSLELFRKIQRAR